MIMDIIVQTIPEKIKIIEELNLSDIIPITANPTGTIP